MKNLRFLPGLSKYGFSESGRIFSFRTHRWLKYSKDTNGYFTLLLINDDGVSSRYLRHRLLARLFLGEPNSPELLVNHKNGIKGDDRIDNLEWVSPTENVEHAGAMGLTPKCFPISVRHVSDGTIHHYPSAVAAARALGMSKDAILWRIHGDPDAVYPEGRQYRKRDDNATWLTGPRKNGRSVVTLMRDIQTGDVLRFEQQGKVAELLSLSLAAVNKAAGDGRQRLLHSRYLLKLEGDPTPWREISNPMLEGVGCCVVVTHASTGNTQTFNTAKECAEVMGLKATTLNERLNKGGQRIYADGYSYSRL
jgi:hypothetical protein